MPPHGLQGFVVVGLFGRQLFSQSGKLFVEFGDLGINGSYFLIGQIDNLLAGDYLTGEEVQPV
ncbi:hypothetical protein Barb7_00728 [Bacteroidales bacterium Barb7]|nr:hypothetical protein Barb7_00728 [Bacteroidales bacterium Barb7]